MSNLVTIPNAVVTYLNTLTLSMHFKAVKKDFPSLELKDFIDLQVHILTGKKTVDLDTRASKMTEIEVYVLIKKVINKDTKSIEPLIAFVEEVNDALLGIVITDTGVKCACVRSVFEACPDMQQLNSQNVFTGALTLTYKDLNRV